MMKADEILAAKPDVSRNGNTFANGRSGRTMSVGPGVHTKPIAARCGSRPRTTYDEFATRLMASVMMTPKPKTRIAAANRYTANKPIHSLLRATHCPRPNEALAGRTMRSEPTSSMDEIAVIVRALVVGPSWERSLQVSLLRRVAGSAGCSAGCSAGRLPKVRVQSFPNGTGR